MVKQREQYFLSQDEIMLLIFLVSCVSLFFYNKSLDIWQELRRVPVVEQQLLPLSDHLSSLGFYRGVRVGLSLVFICVMFCELLFVLCQFDHCIVRSSLSDYEYPRYFQTEMILFDCLFDNGCIILLLLILAKCFLMNEWLFLLSIALWFSDDNLICKQ